MVSNVTSLTNNGLRDWLWQRISAVVFLVYVAVILSTVFCKSGLTYQEWKTLHACSVMKVLSVLAILSLVIHSWIGIWTVSTDYLKNAFIRLTIQFATLLMLVSTFIWSLAVIWRV